MLKLLVISVTYHMPQNRVSNILTHVTLNTMNGVVYFNYNTYNEASTWQLGGVIFTLFTRRIVHPNTIHQIYYS